MRKIRNITIVLSLLVITFGLGFNLGKGKSSTSQSQTLVNESRSFMRGLDFSLFWDVWDRLLYYYIDKKALESQKMIYGAISGMVSSLDDPYTVFLSPEQNQEAKNDLGGKFEGIGAQLGVKDKKIVVVAPLKDSPAEASGLEPGDWIIKVDGQESLSWSLPEAVAKIRGPKGSKVVLTILHKDAEKSTDVEVLRDEIKVASVEWEEKIVDCDRSQSDQQETVSCEILTADCVSCGWVIYLKLGRFGDNTNSEWNRVVSEIVKAISIDSSKKVMGLILDVRNNPGGYLSGSVFIASEFIAEGPVVIQENADRKRKTYNVERKGKLTNIPMVVLINKGSASASEIVAGSLKVRRNVPLVGEATFGKGTIQEAQDLAKGAGIHITTAKWLLPDNTWINGSGLKPTINVENNENNPDVDSQLLKAIEILYQNYLD